MTHAAENLGKSLHFAATMSRLMLANTAAASEVVRAIIAITEHDGLQGVRADVTYNQIVITYRDVYGKPHVWIEAIPGRDFNFGSYTELARLLDDYLVARTLTLDEALARVHALEHATPRYGTGVIRLICGVAGALVAVIFGAGWLAAGVAFVANIVVHWVFTILGARRWPSFFLQIISGFTAALSAAVVVAVHPTADGSQVVVAVIMIMLAGMTSTGAVQDLLTGWYLTGTGRLIEAFVNTIGLIVGVQLGMRILALADIHLTVGSDVDVAPHPVWVMLIAATLTACSFCIVAGLRLQAMPAAAVLTCGTWFSFYLLSQFGADAVWASGVAALFAGLVSPVLGGLMRIPAANLASIAIILMFPGLLLYRGLLSWGTDINDGITLLLQALSTAMALAIGVMFGQYLTSEVAGFLTRARRHPSTFLPHFLRPFRARPEKELIRTCPPL
ncbi:threonine/serine exporter ThrE family protein [Corynebacterium sp.]|uniref:threonine/serine ThrE exporter family protein n=1 Tax=Corynebacterium sp. TaxID=1720 RepID=UPI0026DF3B71|nr:threonine/serine exporter family protein [Corynebacterium sp.]MDO5512007.1 threonine/serine exporter family protein [Corynebacterium sp.]